MFYLEKLDGNTKTDLSNYVISYDWSGDLGQAGRKLNFTLAYTNAKKDKRWINSVVRMGDTVHFYYVDEESEKKQQYDLFTGRVFMHSRNSESYTAEYVAYDNLIYLSKNKVTIKFDDISISGVIQQVCNDIGISIGSMCEGLDRHISFIADNQSGTQAIQKALEIAHQWNGYRYHFYLAPDGKLNVVKLGDDKVANYTASDETNLKGCSYSESIEDMVNSVVIVDKAGQIIGYADNTEDQQAYGRMLTYSKYDEKQTTEIQAKGLIKRTAYNCKLSAIGNIQCIAGYTISISDEQVIGDYIIKSDSHKIENNIHTMDLDIAYTDHQPDNTAYVSTGITPITKGTKQTGSSNVTGDLSTAEQAMNGYQSQYGRNGCVDVATHTAAYYSPFAKQEANNGVVDVPTLYKDADAKGLVVPFSEANVEPGDMIGVNGTDGVYHVVVAEGNGYGCFANCSSVNGGTAMHQGSYYDQFSGTNPTFIIKTSRG